MYNKVEIHPNPPGEEPENMTHYRVLNGIAADDLIADWSKYCAANGMKLGVPADERHHAVLMIAERREARLYIEHPAGATSGETLEQYLTDYLRRHPQDSVEDVDSEEILREACVDEDNVGFIVEG